MMDIEDRLPGILVAEADRHEVPVFSAQRIAENAVRKGFWRRRRLLALMAIGLAGATGGAGAVVAASGHEKHDRMTVTFYDITKASVNPETARELDSWIRTRAKADGLKDVDVKVQPSPLTVAVTGRASDTARLRMLGISGRLDLISEQPNPDPDHSGTTLPLEQCVERESIGPLIRICDDKGHLYSLTRVENQAPMTVSAAHAEHRGPGADGWTVVLQLRPDDAQHLGNVTAYLADKPAVLIVQAASVTLAQIKPVPHITDGAVEGDTGFTEQQARDLAVDLLNPGPVAAMGLGQADVSPMLQTGSPQAQTGSPQPPTLSTR